MLLEEDDEDEFEEVSVSMTMRSLDEESAMRSKALGAHGSGRIRRASLYLAAFHGEGHAAVGTPPARSSSGGKKPDPASRNSGEVSGGLDEKSGWRKAQSVRRTTLSAYNELTSFAVKRSSSSSTVTKSAEGGGASAGPPTLTKPSAEYVAKYTSSKSSGRIKWADEAKAADAPAV